MFSLKFIPMTIVHKLVREIEICKSSGIPDLSAQMLKDAFLVLVPELTHLFNESIQQGVYPKAWRSGFITPIPKDGDPLDPGNWRPISILPLPSKLLEKAIHHQVTIFLDNNNVLDDRQHGFRSHFSTSTAIFKLTKEMFDCYDKGNNSSCVFVDYKKAFETLDHNILCKKLKKYNFSELSVQWFKSYLSDRLHIVQTNSDQSKPSLVPYGVPQGSTLGPLLFILYVNDIFNALSTAPEKDILMYADDTVLYSMDRDPRNSLAMTQGLVAELSSWCKRNKLTINTVKTKHMFIPRTKCMMDVIVNESVNVGADSLANVTTYKYLGVDITNTLSFDVMIDNSYNKANRKLYKLKYIRPYITNKVANLIYKTCVRSLMEYADFLIDSCTKSKVEKLEKIQKRAVKLIDQATHKGTTYSDLLIVYGLDALERRRKKHHLSVMYRHSLDISNLVSERPGIDLRSNSKIKFNHKVTQLTKVQKSPYYRGITCGTVSLQGFREQRLR